jgi:hypothetical protein
MSALVMGCLPLPDVFVGESAQMLAALPRVRVHLLELSIERARNPLARRRLAVVAEDRTDRTVG